MAIYAAFTRIAVERSFMPSAGTLSRTTGHCVL